MPFALILIMQLFLFYHKMNFKFFRKQMILIEKLFDQLNLEEVFSIDFKSNFFINLFKK